MTRILRETAKFVAVVLGGGLGGTVICFIAILWAFLIGTSGYTGAPESAWNPDFAVWFAVNFGAVFGVLLLPIGYYLFLRHGNALRNAAVAGGWTLTGTLAGAMVSPVFAGMAGAMTFFLACAIISSRTRPTEQAPPRLPSPTR